MIATDRRPGRIVAAAATFALVTIAAGLVAGPARATRTVRLSDGDDAAGPLDLRGASLSQHSNTVTLRLSVQDALSPSDLDFRPSFSGPGQESYLCTELVQKVRAAVCFGKNVQGRLVLYRAPLGDGLTPGTWSYVHKVKLTQPSDHSISVSGPISELGLRYGHLVWRVLSDYSQAPCDTTPTACADEAPDSGPARTQILKPRVVGCTRDEHRINFHGPRRRKRVALTFDDGPSAYTSRILTTLRRRHAHATFFVIGQEVAGRGALLRRELREGNEIGNHTLHHEVSASSSSIASTQRIIRHATGFTPCTFRPPDGALGGGVAGRAWSQHMSTIVWDIDTRDWSLPGSGAIASRASAAHSGSIVIMHDGGGPRGETAAALPSIIHRLRARGFELVTVSKLLGEHFIVRP